jgi:hypothetical protein
MSGVTATKQDPAARLCVLYRVVDQIADNRSEKQRIAYDPGLGKDPPNLNTLLQGGSFMFSKDIIQQRAKVHRR